MSSDEDGEDADYSFAGNVRGGGAGRKKRRKSGMPDNDDTYGLAGDFSGDETGGITGDGEDEDYSFAGHVKPQAKKGGRGKARSKKKVKGRGASGKSTRSGVSSEDDYGLAADVLSDENGTGDESDDYKMAVDVISETDSLPGGGRGDDDDDDEAMYSRVQK